VDLSNIELPPNRKFGLFFTAIFIVIGAYLFSVGLTGYSYLLFSVAVLFLLITLVNADLLLPLNKVWMMLGLLLGMIVSPIVLGIIFFSLFVPIGMFMRLFGRDELRLKLKPRQSYWRERNTDAPQSEAFINQF